MKNHRDARARLKLDAYVEALLLEIQHGGVVRLRRTLLPRCPARFRLHRRHLLPPSPEHLRRILDALRRRYGLGPRAGIPRITLQLEVTRTPTNTHI